MFSKIGKAAPKKWIFATFGALAVVGAIAVPIGVVYGVPPPVEIPVVEMNYGTAATLPYKTGYAASIVRNSLGVEEDKLKETAVGTSGVTLTVRYTPNATLPADQYYAFETVYRLSVLPATVAFDEESLVGVPVGNDKRARYYSELYPADPASAAPVVDPKSETVKVTSVHDGDTFKISGQTASLRLFGVDTAEISEPTTAPKAWTATAGRELKWATNAKIFVEKALSTDAGFQNIYLTTNGKDVFNRTVGNIKYVPAEPNLLPSSPRVDAKVPVQDRQLVWNDLGADLVSLGLARVAYVESDFLKDVNPRNKTYIDYLFELQAGAVSARRGLWAEARQNWFNDGSSVGDVWNGNDAVFPKTAGLLTGSGAFGA